MLGLSSTVYHCDSVENGKNVDIERCVRRKSAETGCLNSRRWRWRRRESIAAGTATLSTYRR